MLRSSAGLPGGCLIWQAWPGELLSAPRAYLSTDKALWQSYQLSQLSRFAIYWRFGSLLDLHTGYSGTTAPGSKLAQYGRQ